MLTTTDLLAFDGSGYSLVIEKWGRAAAAVSSASNTISGIGDQMSDWTGPAASQALATMTDLVVVVASNPGLLNDAQDTVAAFVATVNQQQEILKSAMAKADSLHCTIGLDGTVTAPPQPPGEPPQSCLPDPIQEAARAKAQEAYNNTPAVQTWQAATQQAPALEATIQGALKAAAAADGRASGDLEAGTRGGTDVQRIVTGQDPTGSYAVNLYADTQTLADGQRWVQRLAEQAAGLLPKAAEGDAAAVAQLEAMTPLSYDQDFGANLMNRLGAAGLEALPVEMGQKLQDLAPGGSPDLPSLLRGDQGVLRFLGDSLASASNSPNLSADFVNGLTNNDSALSAYGRLPGPAGFWSLGQILGASSGAVPYDPQFLDTVGTAIINFDRHQDPILGYEDIGPFFYPWANNLNLSPDAVLSLSASFHGVSDSGGDPVYGLMHVAAFSPAAAQTLFGSHGNLNAVLTQLSWNFDHGSALGAALQAATTGPGAATASLTSNIVHILALQYADDSSYAAQMSGLNAHVANILAQPQNLMALNQAVAENVQNKPGTWFRYPAIDGEGGIGPSFQSTDLALVLGFISQTPSAYATLQSHEAHYLATELNQAVANALAQPGGLHNPLGSSGIQQALSQGMTTLAFMGMLKTVVAQQATDASAASLIRDLADGSFATSALSVATAAVPVVSIPAGIVSAALGTIGANVQASNAPTVAGAQQELTLPGFGTIALANALLKNHAAPPTDFGNSSGKFWGPGNQLLPTKDLMGNETAYADMNAWFETLPAVGPFTFNQVMINESVIGALNAKANMTATGG